MNILMIEVPTAEKDGSVPFGLLYAASSAYRHGHNVKIIDLVKEDRSYGDIKNIINSFSPGLIGLGGITSSYKNCKELVYNIKRNFAHIPIAVGGVLSSVEELLLRKVHVDFIVHGEGEISFPNLINALENKNDIHSVKGISFLEEGKKYSTGIQPQISELDDIPMPEYSLLNMTHYLEPAQDWVNYYFKYDRPERENMLDKLSDKKMFPIITSRGCSHRCIFCYRHHRGLRQHSVEYVINTIKHLKTQYGIDVFQLNDELTTVNKKWVLKFCNSIINEKINIYFIVLSSRVDTVDEETINRLKEAGCLMINYGYESGSNVILQEIKKGVTREQALEAGFITKKAGLKNIPEIIIGFPSENKDTVADTIDFLQQIDTWPISVNTPIPFPKTPLWQYATEHGLIKEEEDFILGYKRGVFINFTKYSDTQLARFVDKVKYEVKLNWLKNRKKHFFYIKLYATYSLKRILVHYIKPVLPKKSYAFSRRILSNLLKVD